MPIDPKLLDACVPGAVQAAERTLDGLSDLLRETGHPWFARPAATPRHHGPMAAERAADAALERDLRRWEEAQAEADAEADREPEPRRCGYPMPGTAGRLRCDLPEDHEGDHGCDGRPQTWQAPGPDGQPGLAVTGLRLQWEEP